MKKEDAVLKEIIKELNFKEKIIAKLYKDLVIKIYSCGMKNGYNWKQRKY